MKKIILVFFVIFIVSAHAQKNDAAEQYIKALNAYDAGKLSELLTDDFQLSYYFAHSYIDKKTFLEGLIPWSKLYHARYEIIQTGKGNPVTYELKDHNDYYTFLDIEATSYNFTITTKDTKVTKVSLDTVPGYYEYAKKLVAKETAFFKWRNYHYPEFASKDPFAENSADYYPQLKLYSELPESERIVPEPEIVEPEVTETEYPETESTAPAPGSAHEMSSEENNQFDRDMACKHRNTYSAAKRMQLYPFSKAKKVALIAFSNDMEYSEDAVSKTNRVPNMSVATAVKFLDKIQLDKLTDIIYNNGFTKLTYSVEEAMPCPELKNAIVFLDANDKPFEYIGLYFGCDIREYSSEKVKDGDYCTEKFDMLRQFFISLEIPVGKLD